MNRQTLRTCPPDLRTETLRLLEKRLSKAAEEVAICADLAKQLRLRSPASGLLESWASIEAAREAVIGGAS